MSRPEDRLAVAVTYGEDGKPQVVATGRGHVAERMVEKARESGVEVQQDPKRVRELLEAESEGGSIPLEIYELMATVITFAQELNEARVAPGLHDE